MGLFSLLKRPKPPRVAPRAVVMRELPSPKSPAQLMPIAPPPPTPAELRRQLFDAIAKGDEARLATLCREHRTFINEYAPTWMIVPESLRTNPAAAEWYAQGLQQLTRLSAG
jgi:hypothetical protein